MTFLASVCESDDSEERRIIWLPEILLQKCYDTVSVKKQ